MLLTIGVFIAYLEYLEHNERSIVLSIPFEILREIVQTNSRLIASYSRAERRHVDVLLPAAQSAPSGGGGTQEAAETRQGQPGRSTWDQSHGPVPTDGWIHAVLQSGTSGPEQTLRAGPSATQRLAR